MAQIASLSQNDEPVLLECEEATGLERLQAMRAEPPELLQEPQPERPRSAPPEPKPWETKK